MVIVGAIGAMQVASHSQGRPAAVVDDAALRNADARTADWITHGRTYGEQRFSPLTSINEVARGELNGLGNARCELRMCDGDPLKLGIEAGAGTNCADLVGLDAKTRLQLPQQECHLDRLSTSIAVHLV